MAKILRTFAEIVFLDRIQKRYQAEHDGDQETKLCANMRNVEKQMNKITTLREADLQNLRLDYCMLDEKTQRILKDDKGNLEYTKAKAKELEAAIAEYNNNHKFELDARIVPDFRVECLTEEEREVFSGVYIPEQPVDENGVFLPIPKAVNPADLVRLDMSEPVSTEEPVSNN
jgi:hypothetical protein